MFRPRYTSSHRGSLCQTSASLSRARCWDGNHQQVYVSWPGVVFDTVKKASEEHDKIREMLAQLLATQAVSESHHFFMLPRLRSMIEDDSQMACELLLRTWYLGQEYQAAIESVLPRTWQARSELVSLKMELSYQDQALAILRSQQAELCQTGNGGSRLC
jgi:hypothetical protein